MASAGMLVSDFIISFMWVWSGVLIKIFVYKILELGHEPSGEVIKCALSIINMFFFAFLGKTTKGGAYNPLTVFAGAISGDFKRFLFDVGARIPAQPPARRSPSLSLTASLLIISGGTIAARITFTNNCQTTIWPGTLTVDQKPQLSITGFELASKASSSIDVQAPWNGRFWARTRCTTDASGKFTCETADCGSGQVACKGNGAVLPASLVEINLAADGGQDFYDVSLVDGFNLPVSVATQGGTGDCQPSTCLADVNAVCPTELQVKGSDGIVIACKSACLAFNEPQYCCTGNHGTPKTCRATNYSMIFKNQCPQAYSYAYDDQNSTFTCSGPPNYVITFCPARQKRGTIAARITFTNNCPTTIWPGTLTLDQKPQLSTTGFELASKASLSIDVQAPWIGRFWARTRCTTDASGKFTCETGDCGSGQVACNGNGATPPTSLVEINIAADGGQDFYDVSLVDGFNLPVSIATQGGTGDCRSSTCPTDVNAVCPAELQVKGSDGSVIACKSACLAFNESQYCCTGDHNTPETCSPTNYSKIFKNQCSQAYSYAYDNIINNFTCFNAPNYAITFCP